MVSVAEDKDAMQSTCWTATNDDQEVIEASFYQSFISFSRHRNVADMLRFLCVKST